ncbi:hypothetical protein Hdeb2414_s0002g00055271 [Helianthus debilis subsp. tardiflorus]
MDFSFRYIISSEKRQKSFIVYSILFYTKFRKMHSFLMCCDSNNILLNEIDKTSRKRYCGQTYVGFYVLLLMNIIMARIRRMTLMSVLKIHIQTKNSCHIAFPNAQKNTSMTKPNRVNMFQRRKRLTTVKI